MTGANPTSNEATSADAGGASRHDPTVPLAPAVVGVSVRSLCEFTARHGDLDRRFTPSATAQEGITGQATVVARRGADYRREHALEGRVGALQVRGRADGYVPSRQRLEEIKTIRGAADDVPANRRHLHWAQLETYGALLCRGDGLVEVELALVYVDAVTDLETVLTRQCSAADLDAAFVERCGRYLAWALQEAAHRTARDAALAELPFPPGAFRPGQRGLAEAVYRAAVAGRCLLAQAPTGIGKTIGTLYPLLRAMPGQRLDKLAFMTCKGTGRIAALEALGQVRDALNEAPRTAPAMPLRVLVMVAKEQACEHPGSACHGEACPLAKGFYDRLPAARAEAVAAGWLDAPAQRRVALAHGICPYYLGQELLRWADVIVGDVHHAFDPNGQLIALAQALDWRLALLIDEAHNLIERARRMHTAELGIAESRDALAAAPPSLAAPIERWLRALGAAAHEQAADYAAHETIPEPIADALQALATALGEHLQAQPLAASAAGPLLGFYFAVLRLQRGVERFGAHSVFDIQKVGADPIGPALRTGAMALTSERAFDAVATVRNIVPAAFLRPRFAACHASVLFSATLGPPAYQRDLLGLPDDTAWLDVAPPFDGAHLTVRIADRVSTRFAHRGASLDAVADLMARQYAGRPGNYLAFFSSFAYLEQAAVRLAGRHPALPQWRQSRAMGETDRHAFLDRFVADGRGIGFAVLGGAFAEGIDLPGTRLIGAFVATLGLPPVSPVLDQFRRRLDALFGADHGYADRIPGLQKVVQAAGRVLRSPDDRGCLWLIDDRYRRPEVQALLPAWWRIEASREAADAPLVTA